MTFSSSAYIKNDTINHTIVLVDKAVLTSGEITIKADSIVFNTRTYQIYATGRQDGFGTIIGKPFFKEGSQEMEADEITYNLVTRKATIKNIKGQVNLKQSGSETLDNSITYKEFDKTNTKDTTPIEKPEIFPIRKGEYGEIPIPFGEKRLNLNTKNDTVMYHYGIDLVAKLGTEVMATAGGKVIIASWEKGENRSYGNLIMIDHGDGCQSVYAHLNDFSVKSGDTVKKGQIIGHVGSSGLSTSAHLHFEIRIKGERVNPLTYLNH
jgi:murein DD-endopeptidase MepM/ murein hydrolase activator NlpD